MVSINDVQRINTLVGEFQMNDNAIRIMEGASRIVSMNVARVTEEGRPDSSFQVNTSYMPAPENMIAQIRVLMQQRQEVIRQELHTLGVTDISAMAAPAKAPAPTGKRR